MFSAPSISIHGPPIEGLSIFYWAQGVKETERSLACRKPPSPCQNKLGSWAGHKESTSQSAGAGGNRIESGRSPPHAELFTANVGGDPFLLGLAGGQAGVYLEWLAGFKRLDLDSTSVRPDNNVVAVGVGGGCSPLGLVVLVGPIDASIRVSTAIPLKCRRIWDERAAE